MFSRQRPSVPAVHCESVEHAAMPPFLMVQSPAGAGCEHSASLVRWLSGTRPPSVPLDVPLLEVEPLEVPLLDTDPLDVEPLES